jgi:hypothetical protein
VHCNSEAVISGVRFCYQRELGNLGSHSIKDRRENSPHADVTDLFLQLTKLFKSDNFSIIHSEASCLRFYLVSRLVSIS